MAEIINLRRAAKAIRRREKDIQAQANRERHGRTKSQKDLDARTRKLDEAKLDRLQLTQDELPDPTSNK